MDSDQEECETTRVEGNDTCAPTCYSSLLTHRLLQIIRHIARSNLHRNSYLLLAGRVEEDEPLAPLLDGGDEVGCPSGTVARRRRERDI